MRVSAVDGVDDGWSLDDTVELARELKRCGVDMVDCSSGGLCGSAVVNKVPRGACYQVPYAQRVRQEAGIATLAVGLILTPQMAAEIVDDERADLVAIGREALVNANWPHVARTTLEPEHGYGHWPQQSGRWLDHRAAILLTD